jgi:hypothetical protein
MCHIKALHIGAILLFAFGSLLLPAHAQVAPQQDTVKELSKDLGELNRLVTQLRAAEQQAPGFVPMVHIPRDVEGKAEPSEQAESTARFHEGETARVIEQRGDWALVEGPDKKVGWLSWPSAGLESAAGRHSPTRLSRSYGCSKRCAQSISRAQS